MQKPFAGACALFAAVVLVLAACKENNVNQSSTSANVGAACVTADDCGPSAVCALGVCRVGCTNDAECPQDSLCVGDRPPYGCTTAKEGACSSASPCPTGLVCGIDGRCRHECADRTDCPRNEHECVVGTCVSRSEPGADKTWFSCREGEEACVDSAEVSGRALQPPDTTQPPDAYCVDGCAPEDKDCPRAVWVQTSRGALGGFTGARMASVHMICNVIGPGWQVLEDCRSWARCIGALPNSPMGGIAYDYKCHTAKKPPLKSEYCSDWIGDPECKSIFEEAEACFAKLPPPGPGSTAVPQFCYDASTPPDCCEVNKPVCKGGALGDCAAPFWREKSPATSCP